MSNRSIALKNCDHLLIDTVAAEWAKESVNKSRYEIWEMIVAAYRLGEFEVDGVGCSMLNGVLPSNNGEFIAYSREELSGLGDSKGETLWSPVLPTEDDYRRHAALP